MITEYEDKITSFERKVDQLTMELTYLKTPAPLNEINTDELLIVSGPEPASFEWGIR